MQDQGSWDDCPAGVVTDMAGRLRRRERHVQLGAALSIGLTVLMLVAVGYGLSSPDEPSSRPGLNCREAVPLFAKYNNNTLDAAVAGDVRKHLSDCPKCRQHYEELYPSEVRNRSSVENRLLAIADPFDR